MRTLCISEKFKLKLFLFLILLAISGYSLAQSGSKSNSLIINKDELVLKERDVLNGQEVLELPKGKPIKAFKKGGEKAKVLDKFIKIQHVAGLLILHKGEIRIEKYALGHSKTNLWSSLSVAKSVTSTLVGVAIKEGFIKSEEDYVTHYLPDLKGSELDSVRIRHLLTMTSGLKWNEVYTDPDSDIAGFEKDSIDEGMKAIVSYMRKLPAEAEPGKKFNYSTGETHLLGAVLSSATKKNLSEYLSEKIWVPYGMEQNATWRLDRTGQEMAGCCLQMRLRDFGRFGQFMLEGGQIKGESLLPEKWFEKATQIQMTLWPGGGYGYGWWIFNDHSFQALGIYGQLIYIDPSRDLVVAINSKWPEADSNARHFAVSLFIKTITDEIDKEIKALPKK